VAYQLKWRPPGPVCGAYVRHRPGAGGDELPIDIIWGPIGSGKTAGTEMRIFAHACEMPPGVDGWRRSKWLAVRNTGPMLETTTIPSWLDWFPEHAFGRFNWSPPYSHTIRLEEQKIELEMLFMPMDRPDQIRAALGLELTGVWANEARELSRDVLINLRSRCGRYPSQRSLGGKPFWAGLIGDTNAPEDELHYLAMWAGLTQPPDWMDPATVRMMTKPEGVTIFMQPPGLLPVRDRQGRVQEFGDNPKAENLQNLRPGYYRSQLAGNTSAWVLNMVCGEVGKSTPTRAVHPDFARDVHVAQRPLVWDPKRPLLVGMDFARNPAMAVAQEVDGVLLVLKEWIGTNISVQLFVRKVMPELRQAFPDAEIRGWGDPSGGNRTGADDSTAFTHAREEGLVLVRCWTNDPEERIAAVDRRLTTLSGGSPRLIFCPKGCPTLISGLAGAYAFHRVMVEGTVDQFHEEPRKNLYSHICDGLQYLAAGLDRGSKRTPLQQQMAARMGPIPNGRQKYDPLSRAIGRRR
jgi:hypothetical protein